jgi:uncharacterized membrane protein
MNRQTYISELTNGLKANNVEDIEDIIAEYQEHFARKMADGYTEEEIAAKLGKPKEIAGQFAPARERGESKAAKKAVLKTGLFFSDLFVGMFFIVMYAWVIVLGAFALSAGCVGVILLIKPALPEGVLFIPYIPYVGSVLLGITMIALGALVSVLTVYSNSLTRQLVRAYLRWHKNTLSDGKYPPLDKHPMLKDNMRRKLRSLSLIALIVFGVSFILGFIVLAISAGSLGFWHEWNWFV